MAGRWRRTFRVILMALSDEQLDGEFWLQMGHSFLYPLFDGTVRGKYNLLFYRVHGMSVVGWRRRMIAKHSITRNYYNKNSCNGYLFLRLSLESCFRNIEFLESISPLLCQLTFRSLLYHAISNDWPLTYLMPFRDTSLAHCTVSLFTEQKKHCLATISIAAIKVAAAALDAQITAKCVCRKTIS